MTFPVLARWDLIATIKGRTLSGDNGTRVENIKGGQNFYWKPATYVSFKW
jgi:hypothetical protein